MSKRKELEEIKKLYNPHNIPTNKGFITPNQEAQYLHHTKLGMYQYNYTDDQGVIIVYRDMSSTDVPKMKYATITQDGGFYEE
tara:strand:+ start:1748 stop:1996 length:249 start_codon:yes stop_codon:yes gene_type:complete